MWECVRIMAGVTVCGLAIGEVVCARVLVRTALL